MNWSERIKREPTCFILLNIYIYVQCAHCFRAIYLFSLSIFVNFSLSFACAFVYIASNFVVTKILRDEKKVNGMVSVYGFSLHMASCNIWIQCGVLRKLLVLAADIRTWTIIGCKIIRTHMKWILCNLKYYDDSYSSFFLVVPIPDLSNKTIKYTEEMWAKW